MLQKQTLCLQKLFLYVAKNNNCLHKNIKNSKYPKIHSKKPIFSSPNIFSFSFKKFFFAKTFKTFYFCIFSCKKHIFSLARPYFFHSNQHFSSFYRAKQLHFYVQKHMCFYYSIKKHTFLHKNLQFSLAPPYFYHIYKQIFHISSCKNQFVHFCKTYAKNQLHLLCKIKSNSHTALQFLHLLCMV